MSSIHGEWFSRVNNQSPKGIFVVCHGLNLRPQKMNYACQRLSELGFHIYNIYLDGHRNSEENLKSITRITWLNKIRQALNEVKCSVNFNSSLPVYYLGFSIGALLLVDFLSSIEEVGAIEVDLKFKKWFMIAPGFAVRPSIISILNQLGRIRFPFNIPSLSHREYQVHNSLPVSIYQNLIESYNSVHKNTQILKVNIPTHIYIDPKDEFISPKEILKFIKKFHLHNWNLHIVPKKENTSIKYPHHLYVDKDSGIEGLLEKILIQLDESEIDTVNK